MSRRLVAAGSVAPDAADSPFCGIAIARVTVADEMMPAPAGADLIYGVARYAPRGLRMAAGLRPRTYALDECFRLLSEHPR